MKYFGLSILLLVIAHRAIANGESVEEVNVYGTYTPAPGVVWLSPAIFAGYGAGFSPDEIRYLGEYEANTMSGQTKEFSQREKSAIDTTINALIDYADKTNNQKLGSALRALQSGLTNGSASYELIAADNPTRLAGATIGAAAGLVADVLVKGLGLAAKSALVGGVTGAVVGGVLEVTARYAWGSWQRALLNADITLRDELRGYYRTRTFTENITCLALSQRRNGQRVQCH